MTMHCRSDIWCCDSSHQCVVGDDAKYLHSARIMYHNNSIQPCSCYCLCHRSSWVSQGIGCTKLRSSCRQLPAVEVSPSSSSVGAGTGDNVGLARRLYTALYSCTLYNVGGRVSRAQSDQSATSHHTARTCVPSLRASVYQLYLHHTTVLCACAYCVLTNNQWNCQEIFVTVCVQKQEVKYWETFLKTKQQQFAIKWRQYLRTWLLHTELLHFDYHCMIKTENGQRIEQCQIRFCDLCSPEWKWR